MSAFRRLRASSGPSSPCFRPSRIGSRAASKTTDYRFGASRLTANGASPYHSRTPRGLA